jgi:hypothetical protein
MSEEVVSQSASKISSAVTFRPGPLCDTIIASKRLPYIYIQNWKCGCSTIKSTLWTAEHALGLAVSPDYPHRRVEGSPFVADPKRWEHVEREFLFTIVRNPYVRVLSAYLDQIVTNRNSEAWGRFSARHGLGDGPLAFADFLRLLAETPHGAMNPHWRPQYCSVAPSLVPYDFVGAMETFDQDMGLVLARIFEDGPAVQDYAPHQTGSSKKLSQHYGARELALVQQIYEADFTSLGYSMNPERLERIADFPRPNDVPLRTWGKACRLMEGGHFADAAAELEPLRKVISGPTIDDRLLRCYGAMIDAGGRAPSAKGIELIERALACAEGDADLWKQYGRTLRAMGRREDALEAQMRAVSMRSAGSGRDRRVRHLRWRLAFLRASKGRRADALATVRGSVPTNDASRASLLELAGRGMLKVVATGAAAVGAGYWHPDRAMGIAALGGQSTGHPPR